MNKKVLVVNGQSHRIDYSGGASRYCGQLYKRLVEADRAEDLIDFDIYLENFQDVDYSGVAAISRTKRASDLIKHAAFRCCPPIIFEPIHKYFNCINTAGYAVPHYNKTVKHPIPSWSETSSTILIHELTNYQVIGEVGRLCLSSKCLLAVTFLDIQDFYFPEYFSDDILRSRRLVYSFFKDRADVFFAISDFTKQTMIDQLGISPEKIRVTHLAADDLSVLKPPKDVIDWAKSLGRYLIYPAKAWKHKNHDFLLKVLGRRSKELRRSNIRLLLTGGFNEDDTHRLETLIKSNSLHGVVKILGFVSDEQLQVLIRSAEYLVFPSLFEGFGMPILEAMTLGCPVLSSNAGSLPEVGGDAALYFNPDCEDELVALIDSMISGAIDRESMIHKGLENCKRFNWNKTYCETINVYRELLSQSFSS